MFLLFFSIVLSIYFSINYYIYRHIISVFKFNFAGKKIFILLFFVLSSSYFIYRTVDRIYPTAWVKFLGQIGSIWLAVMVYSFLLLLIYDSILILIRIISPNYLRYILSINNFRFYLSGFMVLLISGFIAFGYLNAGKPKVKEIHLKNHHLGKNKLSKPWKIAYASDLHINDLFFPDAIKTLVDEVNKADVDLMLFGGDVFTEDVAHLAYHDSGDLLKNIRSRHGVFTVFGNHEYIGSLDSAINHFKNYHIDILSDSSVIIDNQLVIIGRDDLSAERFFQKKRADLQELIRPESDSLFTILIDHQPKSRIEGKDYPIDLFLSGHTHHGQLFPFNFITQKLFDNSYGLQFKENKYYYVSSGFGFWGPPVRTGSQPEIIIFIIE